MAGGERPVSRRHEPEPGLGLGNSIINLTAGGVTNAAGGITGGGLANNLGALSQANIGWLHNMFGVQGPVHCCSISRA